MGPSRAGSGWVARASAHRASSGQISLLREGEDIWSWFPAAETTSQAAVPTEPEAAQTLLGPMGSQVPGEKEASTTILSQAALGLRFVPRAQFPFAECSFKKRVLFPFGAMPSMVSLPSWYGWVPSTSAHWASSGQFRLLCEGEAVWTWFPALETTSRAAEPTESVAAQTLLGPVASLGVGEN